MPPWPPSLRPRISIGLPYLEFLVPLLVSNLWSNRKQTENKINVKLEVRTGTWILSYLENKRPISQFIIIIIIFY